MEDFIDNYYYYIVRAVKRFVPGASSIAPWSFLTEGLSKLGHVNIFVLHNGHAYRCYILGDLSCETGSAWSSNRRA